MYRRCNFALQQRTEIFICAIKNHHLISELSELPASKYTSITTTSLIESLESRLRSSALVSKGWGLRDEK